jgi:hypothetical protein
MSDGPCRRGLARCEIYTPPRLGCRTARPRLAWLPKISALRSILWIDHRAVAIVNEPRCRVDRSPFRAPFHGLDGVQLIPLKSRCSGWMVSGWLQSHRTSNSQAPVLTTPAITLRVRGLPVVTAILSVTWSELAKQSLTSGLLISDLLRPISPIPTELASAIRRPSGPTGSCEGRMKPPRRATRRDIFQNIRV